MSAQSRYFHDLFTDAHNSVNKKKQMNVSWTLDFIFQKVWFYHARVFFLYGGRGGGGIRDGRLCWEWAHRHFMLYSGGRFPALRSALKTSCTFGWLKLSTRSVRLVIWKHRPLDRSASDCSDFEVFEIWTRVVTRHRPPHQSATGSQIECFLQIHCHLTKA